MIASLILSGVACIAFFLCFGQLLGLYVTNIGKFTYRKQKYICLSMQCVFFAAVVICTLYDQPMACVFVFASQLAVGLIYSLVLRIFSRKQCFADLKRYLTELDAVSQIMQCDNNRIKIAELQSQIRSEYGMYYHVDVIKEVLVTMPAPDLNVNGK